MNEREAKILMNSIFGVAGCVNSSIGGKTMNFYRAKFYNTETGKYFTSTISGKDMSLWKAACQLSMDNPLHRMLCIEETEPLYNKYDIRIITPDKVLTTYALPKTTASADDVRKAFEELFPDCKIEIDTIF